MQCGRGQAAASWCDECVFRPQAINNSVACTHITPANPIDGSDGEPRWVWCVLTTTTTGTGTRVVSHPSIHRSAPCSLGSLHIWCACATPGFRWWHLVWSVFPQGTVRCVILLIYYILDFIKATYIPTATSTTASGGVGNTDSKNRKAHDEGTYVVPHIPVPQLLTAPLRCTGTCSSTSVADGY